jgi:hypothetical protein
MIHAMVKLFYNGGSRPDSMHDFDLFFPAKHTRSTDEIKHSPQEAAAPPQLAALFFGARQK